MKISYTPSWVHKASAFAVGVLGSAVAWDWNNIVSNKTAGLIVASLGMVKLGLEFFTDDKAIQE